MNTRPEPKKISWQLLRGNKYNRALHPAMLNSNGLTKTMSTTPTGSNQQETFIVHYDRSYVVQWLAFKIIKPFQLLSFHQIYELFMEAWVLTHPNEKVPLNVRLVTDSNEE
ncbi:MAG: hypothetical protein ACFCU5_20885 [Pleurocapsa sp.]